MKNTTDETTPRELFLTSLERCESNEGFVPSFYDRFLGSSPDVQERFRFTSFEKQNAMLLNSLRLAAGAISGDRESLQELKSRSETHSRDHLNIDPKLYTSWLAALLATAQVRPSMDRANRGRMAHSARICYSPHGGGLLTTNIRIGYVASTLPLTKLNTVSKVLL